MVRPLVEEIGDKRKTMEEKVTGKDGTELRVSKHESKAPIGRGRVS